MQQHARASPARTGGDAGAAGQQLPPSATVLLVVDFINPLDFPGAQELAPAAMQAAERTVALKRRLAARRVQTLYANDNFGRWRSEFRDVWALCREQGGTAGRIAELLAPAPTDMTILKPRHSAFYATPLELLLGQMGTRRVVLVGLATDICVQLTAMDARMRGYRVWVPGDCTAAESAERHQRALHYLHTVLQLETEESHSFDVVKWEAE